jgi:two-component system, NarL family, sensor histidine kinase DesK
MTRLNTIVDDQLTAESQPRRRLAIRLGVCLGLLYLIGPVTDLASSSLATARVVAIWVGLVLFVVVYLSLMPRSRRLAKLGDGWTLGALAALPAIAIALLLLGAPSSFAGLLVYVVAAAGLLLPYRWSAAVVAAVALGIGVGSAATGAATSATAAWVLTIISIGAIMTGLGRTVRLVGELQATREELARLAVTEERLRIARDLHDLLGHSLSLIALKTELAARVVRQDVDRAAAELADIDRVTRRALAEVRGAVQGYRNLALDEALDGARSALSAAGIDCRLEDAPRMTLPAEVEAVLAWAVREGTTNVVKHSHAHRCDIRVRADADSAAVEVENDGADAAATAPAGSGLTGLAERARAVRGTLEAGPRRDGVFRLHLTIPLTES